MYILSKDQHQHLPDLTMDRLAKCAPIVTALVLCYLPHCALCTSQFISARSTAIPALGVQDQDAINSIVTAIALLWQTSKPHILDSQC